MAIVFFSAVLCAQDPPPPDGLSGQNLRDWLKANWFDSHHSSVGYNAARQAMYSDIDNEAGRVYCVYSGFNQAASFTTFLNPINAEHTVPQQLFDGNEPMRSDVHHVFPTHMDVNSARGSLPFGENDDNLTDNWYIGDDSDLFNISNVPTSDIDLYSERDINIRFEPREDHKGDVARAVFYFYTMYPDEVGAISELGSLTTLHQWHLQDLPDSKEILRNEKIQELQGNFNPYVSMPELVSLAWDLPSSIREFESVFEIYPNPVGDRIYVKSSIQIENIQLLGIDGSFILQSTSADLDVSKLHKGLYLLRINARTLSYTKKILIL
ncbi:MAG: endonuclease [Bacteroidota bacterium]